MTNYSKFQGAHSIFFKTTTYTQCILNLLFCLYSQNCYFLINLNYGMIYNLRSDVKKNMKDDQYEKNILLHFNYRKILFCTQNSHTKKLIHFIIECSLKLKRSIGSRRARILVELKDCCAETRNIK